MPRNKKNKNRGANSSSAASTSSSARRPRTPIAESPPAPSGGRMEAPATDDGGPSTAFGIPKETLAQLHAGIKGALRQLSSVSASMEELEEGVRGRAARAVAAPLADHARWLEKTYRVMDKNLEHSPPPPLILTLYFPGLACTTDWSTPPQKPSSKIPEPSGRGRRRSSSSGTGGGHELLLRPSSARPDASEAASSSGRSHASQEQARGIGPLGKEAAARLWATINSAIVRLRVVHDGTMDVAKRMSDLTMKGWLAGLALNAKDVLDVLAKAEELVLSGGGD